MNDVFGILDSANEFCKAANDIYPGSQYAKDLMIEYMIGLRCGNELEVMLNAGNRDGAVNCFAGLVCSMQIFMLRLERYHAEIHGWPQGEMIVGVMMNLRAQADDE